MSRALGRKDATPEQSAKAEEFKKSHGTFFAAVHAYVTEYWAPGPGVERGETFTTLDVAEKMGVHRSHISGALGRWRDERFELQHENKTHVYLERKPQRGEPQPPWTPPQSSPAGLTEVPSYILQRNADMSMVIWVDGKIYFAKPVTWTE